MTEKRSGTEFIAIERPDITVAQVVLLILSQKGPCSYREIISHPLTSLLASKRTENSYYTALSRLKSRRQVVRSTGTYELTQQGEYAALKAFVRKELVVHERPSPAPKKLQAWDGKWRIVIFDIPETKRPMRDYLRSVLKRLGCKEFQRSMWIFPHKLPPFVSKLFEDPQIRKYARLLTTFDIDYDEDLRRSFRLS